jgi:coproporphyrinogen III oxidase-like Fe-S oxidoreductase
VTQDRRNKFDKKFDEDQAAWLNDDDRNNDALYHRSFDDGSMHLYSSAFRDGKPVDNHGKEIGGMGAKAITAYRRHDTQKGTLEGESATFTPIDEDLDADMHLFTLEALRRGGLERYEVSNFAVPGHESKHNLAYWRQEAWLAAGPSASGHLHGNRWKNVPRLDDYLTFDDHGYSAIVDLETFEPVRALTERIMTGVRILEGLDWGRVLEDADPLRPGARSRLVQTRAKLEGRGLAISDADGKTGSRLILTDGGFMIADAIALELIVAFEGRAG